MSIKKIYIYKAIRTYRFIYINMVVVIPSVDFGEQIIIDAEPQPKLDPSPPLVYDPLTGGLSINNATNTQSGIVSIVAQNFAGIKNFTNGIKLNSGQTITDITTDTTLGLNSDSILPTEKAIKTYVDTAIGGSSAINATTPLNWDVPTHTMSIANADSFVAGVVTSGSQNFGGLKNFYTGFQVGGGQYVTSLSTDGTFASNSDAILSTQKATKSYIDNSDAIKSPGTFIGFENQTDSIITYNPSNQTLTITPTGASYNVWRSGTRRTISTILTLSHTPSIGMYYFYLNNANTLSVNSGTAPSFSTDQSVANVYWYDATHYFLMDERHSVVMDWATHLQLHQTVGCYLKSGLVLSGYTILPGTPNDSHNQYLCSSGIIADEDLETAISAVSAAGPYTCIYMLTSSASWTYVQNTVPFVYTGASFINYNQFTGGAWQQTPLTTGQYTNYYVCFIPSLETGKQLVTIPCQTAYATLESAQGEFFGSLTLGTLPFNEICPLYQITYVANTAYVNTGKCAMANIVQIAETRLSIAQKTPSHQALGNLLAAGTGVVYGHISASTQTIVGAKTFSSILSGSLNTDATSATTGGITTLGGLSTAKQVWVGSNCLVQGTTDSTSAITGAIQTLGGIASAKQIWAGTNVIGASTTNATSLITGAVQSRGGLNCTLDAWIGANCLVQGATDSSSISTGSLRTLGGCGIAKKLYVGDNITTAGSLTAGTTIVSGTTLPQFTVQYDVSNKADFRVSSGGILNIVPTGTDITLTAVTTNITGNVELGNTSQIHFANVVKKKRISIYDVATPNDFQFIGLGLNSADFRHQIADVANKFSFASGITTTTEQVLFDINGALTSNAHLYHTTDSSSSTTGALITDGGFGCAKKAYIGTDLHVVGANTYLDNASPVINFNTYGTITGVNPTTIRVACANFNTTAGTTVIVSDTTDSTALGAGSIVNLGAISCAKNLIVGGSTYLKTTGGTPSALNFYEYATFPITFFTAGPLGGVSITCQAVRIGRLCTLSWNPMTSTPNSVSGFATTNGTGGVSIPARFAPESLQKYLICGGTTTSCFIQVTIWPTTGYFVMGLYTQGSGVTNLPVANINFEQSSVSYPTAV